MPVRVFPQLHKFGNVANRSLFQREKNRCIDRPLAFWSRNSDVFLTKLTYKSWTLRFLYNHALLVSTKLKSELIQK